MHIGGEAVAERPADQILGATNTVTGASVGQGSVSGAGRRGIHERVADMEREGELEDSQEDGDEQCRDHHEFGNSRTPLWVPGAVPIKVKVPCHAPALTHPGDPVDGLVEQFFQARSCDGQKSRNQ